MKTSIALVFVVALAGAVPAFAQGKPLALPDGGGGIGFDDLRYDRRLDRVLVPAGRTGNVDLVDPATLAVTPIAGFSKVATYDTGHGQSVTSVDSGDGWLFATDRTAKKLTVIDPTTKKIVAEAPLAGTPDYVRFVAPTREVWVTEPGKKGIEVFTLSAGKPPVPAHAAFIAVPAGPESLVVDAKRGRAYTHDWKTSTHAIDLKSRAVVTAWTAGCSDPRGIALDEARALLFVGCEDGTATALDVAHDGALVGRVKSGAGVDIIAYDDKRRHLYVPGDESATLAIVGVSDKGALTVLGTVPTAKDAHCVATDEHGHAYVCDPKGGRLLVVTDTY